ncbi:MAG: PPP family 3-phenylpropionic acid transporter [Bradymonadia bacterium]|jgi:PPP family 3-phenylpropionic acid transporter
MQFSRDAIGIRAAYFGYLGAMGLVASYWPLFWQEGLGLIGSQIGIIFGVRTLLGTLSQPALASWAERRSATVVLLRVSTIIGAMGALAMTQMQTFWAVALLWWAVAPPLAAAIPVLDATAVNAVGPAGYGRVRLWGSLGYGVVVGLAGLAFRDVEFARAGEISVWLASACMLFAFGGTLLVRHRGSEASGSERVPSGVASVRARWSLLITSFRRDPSPQRETSVRWTGPLVTFFAVNALHWAGVMVFNIYAGLHVEARGWSASLPGILVAVAIIAEVVALAFAGNLLKPGRSVTWLLPCYAVTAIRWVAFVWAPSPEWLAAIQLLHALSFGLWAAACIDILGRFGPANARATLQGWFSACVLGAGGMIGSVAGGYLIDGLGTDAAFYAAAGADVLAVLAWLAFRTSWRRAEPAQAG